MSILGLTEDLSQSVRMGGLAALCPDPGCGLALWKVPRVTHQPLQAALHAELSSHSSPYMPGCCGCQRNEKVLAWPWLTL